MGKNKKQSIREPAAPAPESAAPADAPSGNAAPPAEASPVPAAAALSSNRQAAAPANPTSTAAPLPKSRLRRLLPDLVKVALAAAVVALGTAIWLKPPLIQASFPYVSYRFEGKTHADAVLFRPLAMPTRYYIQLPRKLAGRYTWFAVDRRREVAALAEAPSHRFFGKRAIKRSDPLGLDLEFRKLDHSEWHVHFLEDAIVFSNAVLTLRLDISSDAPRNPQPN